MPPPKLCRLLEKIASRGNGHLLFEARLRRCQQMAANAIRLSRGAYQATCAAGSNRLLARESSKPSVADD
jgi:hypothetical protein